jgi:hypothetical protein
MEDTGQNAPESLETLQIQQRQLLRGIRDVQMFPIGTFELEVPFGFARCDTARGAFHYNSDKIDYFKIGVLSHLGRENEFLNLGPYNKTDIENRHLAGEELRYITEYTDQGVEVRSVLGVVSTLEEQYWYFERTKEPENTIVVGDPPDMVSLHLAKLKG